MISIGKTLKECRKLRGFSLNELAVDSRLTKSFLSKIENGKREPSLSSLSEICKVLDVPLNIFILLADESADADFELENNKMKEIAWKAISGYG